MKKEIAGHIIGIPLRTTITLEETIFWRLTRKERKVLSDAFEIIVREKRRSCE